MNGRSRILFLPVVLALGLVGGWWTLGENRARGAGEGVEPGVERSVGERGGAQPSAGSVAGEPAAARTQLVREQATVGDGGFVELEVRGLPADWDRLEVQAHRFDAARPSGPLVGPTHALEGTGGRAACRLDLPAGEELYLAVWGPGLRRTTRDEPFALAPGEVRSLVIDVAERCTLTGRVLDLPVPATRTLWLLHAPHPVPGAQRPPHPHPAPLEARLDADGRFRFVGLAPGTASLSLMLGANPIPLLDEQGRSSWPVCGGAPLEVRPARPLVGLAPVDELGQPRADEPFAPIPNRGPAGDPRLHPGGVALVPLEDLSDPGRIGLYLPRRGVYFRDPRLAAPRPGDVLAIETALPNAQAGSIRVQCGEPLPEGLVVDFEHHGPHGPSRLLGLQIAVLLRGARAGAVRMEPLVDGARLVGLPPGLYDLFWSWGGRRAFAQSVPVEAGIETPVRVAAPRLRQIVVRVPRWEELPPELRPIELVLEHHRTRIQGGEARLAVLDPAPLEVLVGHWENFWWSRALPLIPAADAYVLELPVDELRVFPLEVRPILGGRIVAEIEQPAAVRALFPSLPPTRPAQPREGGAPRILHEAGHLPRGWIREYGPDFHLVHGRVESFLPGAPPSLPGAWCDLTLTPPGLLLHVLLESPQSPSHPVPLTLADTSAPLRLWLPAPPGTLLLRDPAGREQRHPLDGSRTRIEIEVR